jgi:hypothetical protein
MSVKYEDPATLRSLERSMFEPVIFPVTRRSLEPLITPLTKNLTPDGSVGKLPGGESDMINDPVTAVVEVSLLPDIVPISAILRLSI